MSTSWLIQNALQRTNKQRTLNDPRGYCSTRNLSERYLNIIETVYTTKKHCLAPLKTLPNSIKNGIFYTVGSSFQNAFNAAFNKRLSPLVRVVNTRISGVDTEQKRQNVGLSAISRFAASPRPKGGEKTENCLQKYTLYKGA